MRSQQQHRLPVEAAMGDQMDYHHNSTRTLPGDNSEFAFDIKHTGTVTLNLTVTAINPSTNGDYVENLARNYTFCGGGYFDGRIDIGGSAENLQEPATLTSGPTETVELGQFRQSSNGNTVNMVNEQVTITLYFSDGSEYQFTIDHVNPSG